MKKDSILSLREKQSDFESLDIDLDSTLRSEQKMEETQVAGVGKQKDSEVSSSRDEQSTQVNLKEMLKDKRQNRRLSIKGQDLYTIMDLPKDSSEEDINSKYRSLARKAHQGLVTIPIIFCWHFTINDCFIKQAN